MKAKGKEVFTLQIERMDEYGEYEVVDDMKYAKTYYSFDDAVEDGKKAYDEYSAIEDTPISVSIMGGEYEMPNGDIYGEPECLETIRAKNRDKFDESTQRKTKMKKLNITKERFEKSRYFQKKYGKLEYVSESGKLFKTNKGKVLMFNEGIFSDIGDSIDDGISKVRKFFHGKPKFKEGDIVMLCMIEWSPCGVSHGGTITKTKWGDNKWYYEVDFGGDSDIDWWPEDALAIDTDPDAGSEKLDRKALIEKYPEFVKRAKTILGKKTRKELGIDESTKKFGKKFKESDLMNDQGKDLEYFGDKLDGIYEQLKSLQKEWEDELRSTDEMDSNYEFYLDQLESANEKILRVWSDIQDDLRPLDM